jgi:hypothetical protein
MCEQGGELIDVEIRGEISEMIGFKNCSGPGMFAGLRGFIKLCAQVIVDALAELSGCHSCGQVGGDGREDITAMKCPAYRTQEEPLAGYVPDLGLFAREYHREHAVIRRHEILSAHFGQ